MCGRPTGGPAATRPRHRCARLGSVRLQLHALAYNLANFLRTLALSQEVEHWSLTTLREAGQDRRPHRASRALRRVPAGRGGGAKAAVRRDPAPDRWAAAAVVAAPGMSLESDHRRQPAGEVRPMIDRESSKACGIGRRTRQNDGSAGPPGEYRPCSPSRGAGTAPGWPWGQISGEFVAELIQVSMDPRSLSEDAWFRSRHPGNPG
jgi:hypothetical protein